MSTERKHKSVAHERLAALAEFRYQLRRFLAFSEMRSEAVGISPQQYQLLQVVAAAPEGQEVSITYSAERMVVRHNSAVELVDRAERAGLVQRGADERDHRRSLVEITPQGNELLNELLRQHLTEVERAAPELTRNLQRLMGK